MMTNKYLEKIAADKKKDTSWNGNGGVIGAAVGAVGGKHLGSLLSNHSSRKTHATIDAPHSSSDLGTIKKMIRDNKLNVSFNTRSHNLDKHYDNGTFGTATKERIRDIDSPAFAPRAGEKSFVAGVKQRNIFGKVTGIKNKDVIMHELGHAKDYATHTKLKIGLNRAGKVGNLGAALALTNKNTEKYAVPLAIASTLPTLRSEGAANYHAYKGIQAHKGVGAANKFLKRLVPHQMGGYLGHAAGAVAGVYVGKKILNEIRNSEKK